MADDGPIVFVDVADEFKIVFTSDEPATETKQEQTNITTANEQFKCNECSKVLDSLDKLSQHIRRVHKGENPFQCTMCQYSTYNKSGFEEHVRIHQGVKPFKCSYCPYRSVSKKYAKKHEQIHRPDNPLKCLSCPYIARTYRMLNSHQKKVHNKKPSKIMSCTLCDRNFEETSRYYTHKKRRKRCNECGVIVCSHMMDEHKMKKHGVKKEMRGRYTFVCKVCEWSSNVKVKILLHVIHHPDQDLSDFQYDLSILKKYEIVT